MKRIGLSVPQNGSRRRDEVERPVTGQVTRSVLSGQMPYAAAPQPFTVDGIPRLPGESWQEYHERALAWITIEASTIPANGRYMSRRRFVACLIVIPLMVGVIFAMAPNLL